MSESITIKGISQGVLATIDSQPDWDDIIEDLTTLIDQQAAFFRGGQLVLDVGERTLNTATLTALMQRLETREINLAGILAEDPDTENIAKGLELATVLEDVPPPAPPPRDDDDDEFGLETIDSEEYGTAGVLIRRTLRSGRTVRSRGHVVVLGDVNSGAEIIAIGDIIVWGKVRGIVHAGAQGDEEAVVCALDLAPVQLRIANLITVPPQDKKRKNVYPEMAHIADGQIEAIPWKP